MRTKIQKWGNSFGVRLSKDIIQKLQLSDKSQVIIEVDQGRIHITPVKYQLDDFINKINENNLHEPGKEEW